MARDKLDPVTKLPRKKNGTLATVSTMLKAMDKIDYRSDDVILETTSRAPPSFALAPQDVHLAIPPEVMAYLNAVKLSRRHDVNPPRSRSHVFLFIMENWDHFAGEPTLRDPSRLDLGGDWYQAHFALFIKDFLIEKQALKLHTMKNKGTANNIANDDSTQANSKTSVNEADEDDAAATESQECEIPSEGRPTPMQNLLTTPDEAHAAGVSGDVIKAASILHTLRHSQTSATLTPAKSVESIQPIQPDLNFSKPSTNIEELMRKYGYGNMLPERIDTPTMSGPDVLGKRKRGRPKIDALRRALEEIIEVADMSPAVKTWLQKALEEDAQGSNGLYEDLEDYAVEHSRRSKRRRGANRQVIQGFVEEAEGDRYAAHDDGETMGYIEFMEDREDLDMMDQSGIILDGEEVELEALKSGGASN